MRETMKNLRQDSQYPDRGSNLISSDYEEHSCKNTKVYPKVSGLAPGARAAKYTALCHKV
jgi:hypothetical protein